jgi:hypothetical protein
VTKEVIVKVRYELVYRKGHRKQVMRLIKPSQLAYGTLLPGGDFRIHALEVVDVET